MTHRLKLLCHASTDAIRAAAFPADEPLDAQGRRRIAALAGRFGQSGQCWTSPAQGARQTAQALGLEAVVEPMLRECNHGRWSGRSFEDVAAQEPDAIQHWLRDPEAAPHGGESIAALMQRVAAWLDVQIGRDGHSIAVVHASVIRAAIIHAIGAPPGSFWRIDVAPLSVAKFSGRGGRWQLAAMGPMAVK